MALAMKQQLTFTDLILFIRDIDSECAVQAGRAVNYSLTLRNWLIGHHITEYEQRGEDRAAYGEKLLQRLSIHLTEQGVSRTEERELRRYRKFYQVYPQIRDSLTPELSEKLLSQSPHEHTVERGDAFPVLIVPGQELLARLSFTHFVELLKCDNPGQQFFYETECMRGNWSVRELRRQIGSLYYERSELSGNKKKLAELAQRNAETAHPKLAIRDPYVFEFLGLKPVEVMSESHLEDQLLDNLQEFLLELGHGFCFEARQKRILIGDNHNFVDLVFYHRILKCHILVELKLEKFGHENIGQLNTYVSWYRHNMMTEGDNPPVGILLCTEKDHALVQYALAGMDNELFVSKYQLELPDKKEIQEFIEKQIRGE
ncbi:PDDEXK nuclease domain-containing protein [Candidatus Electrothrix sp.]|uniref:PDDEXK nuclease domain-containing protein n=1 Tax=Candidatus Electrothrix sp. TaxID=2170559 RepID=UPI0040564DE7